MSNIEQNLAFILSSRYGEDVRQAIHDAIHDCYEDGKAGSVDLVAREQIANLVANEGNTDKDSELVDIRVDIDGKTHTSAGEAVRTQIRARKKRASIITGKIDIRNDTTGAENGSSVTCETLQLNTANGYMFVTSVTFFTYVANELAVFAAKENVYDNSYKIYIDSYSNMVNYKDVYYIGGYYNRRFTNISAIESEAKVIVDGFGFALGNKANRKMEEFYHEELLRTLFEKRHGYYRYKTSEIAWERRSGDENGNPSGSESVNRISMTYKMPTFYGNRLFVIFDGYTLYNANAFFYTYDMELISVKWKIQTYTNEMLMYDIPDNAFYFAIVASAKNAQGSISGASVDSIIIRYVSPESDLLCDISDALMNADNDSTKQIKLLGDSITQGQGSTGMVIYNIEESGQNISVRGNGPDYPEKGPDYVEGRLLATETSRRWYVSTSSLGWSNLLKEYLEEKFSCTVLNYGMSGIGVADLLIYFDNLVEDADDIVIIMIGTNDRIQSSYIYFYNRLHELVKRLFDVGKQVILMSSVPAGLSSETSSYKHMEDINNQIKRVASLWGIGFISLYNQIEEYMEYGDKDIDDYLVDGLHPGDTLYEIMFKKVARSLGVAVKRDGATW